jgi:hypothetical protein
VNDRERERGVAAAAEARGEENRGMFPDPNNPNNPEFARWIGAAPI